MRGAECHGFQFDRCDKSTKCEKWARKAKKQSCQKSSWERLEMAVKYHPILVLWASRKSLETFLTCPDLPRMISNNFALALRAHFLWRSAVQKFSAKRKCFFCVEKEVDDLMQNVHAHLGFVFIVRFIISQSMLKKNYNEEVKITPPQTVGVTQTPYLLVFVVVIFNVFIFNF